MKKLFFYLIITLLFTNYLKAQSIEITGQVVDSDGQDLPGVTILVKGTTTGTISNPNGEYTITVPNSEGTLIFSFVGMKSQEIPIQKQTKINVVMESGAIGLDEVVAIGYGIQKKSDLTGSLSSVSSEDINAYPASGITQALQGRASGVMVTSANSGEPGGDMKIRIRGATSINASSDPLYVVDGFAGGSLPPPEDIQSIEILKDASSTAIYGSRGANGVVLVTTKSGKIGKSQISFNVSTSIQEITKTIDLLNTEQFIEYMNDWSDNIEEPPRYTLPASEYEDTDWQDEIFRQGSIQNYQLSFSGGSDKVTYYLSTTYFGNKGIVINSDFNRISLVNNLNFQASDKLKIGSNIQIRRTNTNGVRTQESSGGPTTGVISSALKFVPTLGIYDANGNFTRNEISDPIDNPYAIATERINEKIIDRTQINLFGEYDISDELRLRVSLGTNIYNRRIGEFIPRTLLDAENVNGKASIEGRKNTNLLNENYLNYTKKINEQHTLSALLGYSYQQSIVETWEAENWSFITDNYSFWNLGGGANYQQPSSELTEWELASWYGRLNYNFDSKYLLTVTGRYDGSSRFGQNNKWAFFPSAALAWNIKEEEFLKNFNTISSLKFRLSYGITGNTDIGSYQSLAKFSDVLTVIDGTTVVAISPTALANSDLTWEQTQQYNIGIDIGLLQNRINITTDYYLMNTKDLLYELPLPRYTGYNTMLTNIGAVQNKGLELAITTRNFINKFQWTTDFNISFNRNKITELAGGDIFYGDIPGHLFPGDSRISQILREGEVVGAFWGYAWDGIYQEGDDFSLEPDKQPGDIKYKDINGDGKIDEGDRTIIGNPHPDYIWGLNNTLSYKNFDLNIFFQAVIGNDVLNVTRLELEQISGRANQTTAALDRWTPSNPSNEVPRAANHSPTISSRWVEDGSYIRLKNLALGYNLPEKILKRLKAFSQVRFYASAQNLLTFTKYKGYDPEISYRSNDNARSNKNIGMDYGSYPAIRTYTFGMNVNF